MEYIKVELVGLTAEQVTDYLYYMIEVKEVSVSYIAQVVSALKVVYNEILKAGITIDFPRMKKEKRLPDILSKGEVVKIIESIRNLKHKAMMVVTYSGGLRVSLTVSLTVKDIDSQRMMIHLRKAKGAKDRYTLLSQKCLAILRDYARIYKPTEWLFEGQEHGKHVTERSAQKVFSNACVQAGIKKEVSIHGLSYPNLYKIQTFFKDA